MIVVVGETAAQVHLDVHSRMESRAEPHPQRLLAVLTPHTKSGCIHASQPPMSCQSATALVSEPTLLGRPDLAPDSPELAMWTQVGAGAGFDKISWRLLMDGSAWTRLGDDEHSSVQRSAATLTIDIELERAGTMWSRLGAALDAAHGAPAPGNSEPHPNGPSEPQSTQLPISSGEPAPALLGPLDLDHSDQT
ncbi:unnamed protein product [Cutaneotrichosporon oleaginosum]